MKEKIESLMELSDKQFGYYIFSHDPIRNKVDVKLKEEIIEKSLECGKKVAKNLKKEYGFKNIVEYLKVLDLELYKKDNNNGIEYIYFGTYQKPNKITIYTNNIKMGTDLVKKWDLNILKGIKLRDIIIAHEIFHHLQEHDKSLYINTNKITLWSVGKFKYRSKLVAQEEIASMAFAKELLNLDFSPNVLDVLLLYPHNKDLAVKIYESIIDSLPKE
ncbi:hypothetical protein [Anaerosalibacter massiliensis]|uniref:Uncharacterized protein n=1 Tax=Anaerosalibacter massiliensis TaxID=1347392 RepID=A0A9X2S683_9FIRM|nr:hypothetical protein [Anaerosalibacter massiliensis]MCR2045388.1 hypothetical protein [Anaerosalibacter massiliensis]